MRSNDGDRRGRRNLAALLVAVILLIIYGSLYPWRFEPLPDTDPFTVLLHSWHYRMDRYFVRDVGVNILLYMPIGFLGVLVIGRKRSWLAAGAMATALGFTLSCMVELVQAFEPVRFTSLIDLTTNTIGAVAGAIVGRAFQRFTFHFERRLLAATPVDPSALVFCGIFAAWLLFPFFPVTGRTTLSMQLHALAQSPVLDPVLIVSAVATWYAMTLMMHPAGLPTGAAAALLALAPLFGQVLVMGRDPAVATFIGAILGCVLGAFLPDSWAIAAAAFVGMIVIRGLAPFHLAHESRQFHWIPFRAMLRMDWDAGVMVLLDKSFYYGTAIWLLRRAGVPIIRATVALSILLLAIEIVQRRMPAHYSDITDPVIALLLGFAVAAFNPSREKGKRSRSQE